MIFAGLPSKAFSIKKASVAKVHIPWAQNRELTWVQVSAAHDHTTGPPVKNNKNSGKTQTKPQEKEYPIFDSSKFLVDPLFGNFLD